MSQNVESNLSERKCLEFSAAKHQHAAGCAAASVPGQKTEGTTGR